MFMRLTSLRSVAGVAACALLLAAARAASAAPAADRTVFGLSWPPPASPLEAISEVSGAVVSEGAGDAIGGGWGAEGVPSAA
jgi:hypothetical protein